LDFSAIDGHYLISNCALLLLSTQAEKTVQGE